MGCQQITTLYQLPGHNRYICNVEEIALCAPIIIDVHSCMNSFTGIIVLQ